MSILLMVVLAQSLHAGAPSGWITLQDAIQKAQQAVPGGVPIKAELDDDNSGFEYEIKLKVTNTLYEVKINPLNGQVKKVEQNTGGGAQQLLAVAQQVLSQGSMTLKQAIQQGQASRPDFYLIEADMRLRNGGVGVFHLEFLRGPMKLELEIRASDGAIVKKSLYGMDAQSSYFEIYNGNPTNLFNTTGQLNALQLLAKAQERFPNGKIFKVEMVSSSNSTLRYRVELVQANKIIRATFHPTNGTLIKQEIRNDPSLLAKLNQSFPTPKITLAQAMSKARAKVPQGFVTEGKLRVQENGARYQIEIMTDAGFIEVRVNSITGAITAIQFSN